MLAWLSRLVDSLLSPSKRQRAAAFAMIESSRHSSLGVGQSLLIRFIRRELDQDLIPSEKRRRERSVVHRGNWFTNHL